MASRDRKVRTQPDNLAAILGIEVYVAKVICDAAKRKNSTPAVKNERKTDTIMGQRYLRNLQSYLNLKF